VPSNVKVSASWKTVSALYTRVGGSWKNVSEGYTKIGGAWKAFFTSVTPLTVNYLVVAGGAGGGGGGGGAGGYRTSAGTSGGGASAESALTLAVATSYTVTVGAGGTAGNGGTSTLGGAGGSSVFSTITSTGGGGGGGGSSQGGATGGSGGGGGMPDSGTGTVSGGSGTANQGFAGGYGQRLANGGGGGASAVGQNANQRGTDTGGNGGNGVASSITGTSVTLAGGGGGVSWSSSGATGGTGGGGAGAFSVTSGGSAGTANTGGGGGGSWSTAFAGGSGIVIIKYPSNYAINPSPGLSHRTVTSAGFNITTFTAGTGTVSFATATTSSYELIQTVYLTASQSSITFDVSGLGSEYQHLQIRMTGRTTRAVSEDGAPIMYFNSDTSSSYRSHYLVGTGSSVVSYDNGTNMGLGSYPGANAGANQFLASVVDILDPFETTKNKTIRVLAGMPGSFNSVRLNSGVWFSTNALTSIQLNANSGSWATGTRISLYGLKGS
jgi:hypothetical protein